MKADDTFMAEVQQLLSDFTAPISFSVKENEMGTCIEVNMYADGKTFFTNEWLQEDDTPKLVANAIRIGLYMNIQSWSID